LNVDEDWLTERRRRDLLYPERALTAGEVLALLRAERARLVQELLERPTVARPDGRE